MRKRISPKEARKILRKVPNGVSFWLCTNRYIRSIKELANVLENISDDTFRYHVNKDKNDFEIWIREVIRDKELSREISRIKTKETLVRKVAERVDELSDIFKKSITARIIHKKKKKKKIKKKRRIIHKKRRSKIKMKKGKKLKKVKRKAKKKHRK